MASQKNEAYYEPVPGETGAYLRSSPFMHACQHSVRAALACSRPSTFEHVQNQLVSQSRDEGHRVQALSHLFDAGEVLATSCAERHAADGVFLPEGEEPEEYILPENPTVTDYLMYPMRSANNFSMRLQHNFGWRFAVQVLSCCQYSLTVLQLLSFHKDA